MLAKIDVWFSSRKVQNAMAKINPRYLARSPVNILKATKFTVEPPSLQSIDDWHHIKMQKKVRPLWPSAAELTQRLPHRTPGPVGASDRCRRDPSWPLQSSWSPPSPP